ncbi:uncharacterized protein ASPGLDRAFT_28452 [Aspergillus glaucus CBS 516.65]|uniref:Uncharacterized protein n=1 Tax=Aspergillus glaucus CBS 516.65 TaxID=1160497 RepID=A0A1L9VBA7_ASPGL|nr:hypothetical protein ASPGLDRAFT_28452 [Aspergillus glaucus CBS 516.65]OJJ81216.1 hypothetical protein ASPGLDRAFT_28452 [Aspergillus glaucus CBS 516.65]
MMAAEIQKKGKGKTAPSLSTLCHIWFCLQRILQAIPLSTDSLFNQIVREGRLVEDVYQRLSAMGGSWCSSADAMNRAMTAPANFCFGSGPKSRNRRLSTLTEKNGPFFNQKYHPQYIRAPLYGLSASSLLKIEARKYQLLTINSTLVRPFTSFHPARTGSADASIVLPKQLDSD